MKHNGQILTLLAVLVFFGTFSSVYAQAPQQQSTAPAYQQGGGLGADPVRQLNLTPEQRERIRSIREQSKEERGAINERARAANRALEEVLDSDNPEEAVVEQRLREVAATQAAVMRMKTLTEIRIRRVLTVEQRVNLRLMQQQAREIRQERLQASPEERRNRQEERSRALQNQRNGIGPLFPRRENQRRPRF